MKCPRCQNSNPTRSKYCRTCGAVLRKSCSSCGKTIPVDSRFCKHCGEEVRSPSPPPNTRSQKKRNSRKSSSIKGIVFSVFGFVVLVIGFFVIRSIQSPPSASLPDQGQLILAPSDSSALPPAASISLQINRIASQMMCPCGECSLVLNVCDCENPGGAREIKEMIGSLLSQGTPEAEILSEVDKKYNNRI